ncbi:hypothetical protein ABIA68_002863 [Stenotrophomonas rhizophila]|uniref:hypothetical protein n=1 Tax=Stenotrophomonas rhizophila TaxID=216778 RepID=UPI00339441C6
MDVWTQEQMDAAGAGYRLMPAPTAEGLKLNKTQLYRDLDFKHGRTPKALENGMQDISPEARWKTVRWYRN